MKTFQILFLVSCFAICSCIEAVDTKTTEEKKLLVVQGYITTQFGPHEFKLSKSAKYGSIFEGFSKQEEDASIFIKDSDGQQTFLTETFPGTYLTPSTFKAEVGKSYSLVINSKSGQYISTEEEVIPVPKLDQVIPEFTLLERGDTLDFISGVKFSARFKDPSDRQNFILWINNSLYELKTRPDLYRCPGPGGGSPCPKDCCALCYRSERVSNEDLFLYDDANTNGNEITTEAYYVPDDGLRFQGKYQMRLEQHSLSREAYQYYKLLKSQLEINGDIFDPPPANINGNIINISNPNSNVIGYFHATDVSIDSVFIEPEFITRKQKIRVINDDCLETRGTTAVKPSYW